MYSRTTVIREHCQGARRSAWPQRSRIASTMVLVARRFEALAGATRRREGARHRRREFGPARGELGAAPAEKQSTPR